jgi:hypothetical protein
MKNLGLFVTFYMNLHTRSRSRSQAKKLGLRLYQKVAAPPAPAPAPQHWLTPSKICKKKYSVMLTTVLQSDGINASWQEH